MSIEFMFNSLFCITLALAAASIWVFIKNGKYSLKVRLIVLGLFLVCLAVLIPLGNQPLIKSDPETEVMYYEETDPETEIETETVQTAEDPEATVQIMTRDQIKQIKKGMSLADVRSIMGSEGTESRYSLLSAGEMISYKWEDTEDKDLMVTFLNDKVEDILYME